MDLSKQKKEYLLNLCKTNGVKGYSKLKKEELIIKLVEAGVENVTDVPVISVEKEKTKIITKPRIEKLNKKLEKYISCEDYKESLFALTEDVSDDTLLELIKEKTDAFIISDTVTSIDYKKYVDDYGVMKAVVELLVKTPKTALAKMSGEQIYSALALFLYEKDTDVFEIVLKKLKKFTLTLHKVEKPEKIVKANKSQKLKVEEHSDDQEEPSDNDSDNDNDHESENESDNE